MTHKDILIKTAISNKWIGKRILKGLEQRTEKMLVPGGVKKYMPKTVSQIRNITEMLKKRKNNIKNILRSGMDSNTKKILKSLGI